MSKARMSKGRTIAAHAILIAYTLIALFPVFVIVINSFKSRRAIFAARRRVRGRARLCTDEYIRCRRGVKRFLYRSVNFFC